MIITLRSILDEIVEHSCISSYSEYHISLNDFDAVDALATTVANLNERQGHQSETSCAVITFENTDKTKFIMLGISVADDENGIPFYSVKIVMCSDDDSTPHMVGHKYNSLAFDALWYRFNTLCMDVREFCLAICNI